MVSIKKEVRGFQPAHTVFESIQAGFPGQLLRAAIKYGIRILVLKITLRALVRVQGFGPLNYFFTAPVRL